MRRFLVRAFVTAGVAIAMAPVSPVNAVSRVAAASKTAKPPTTTAPPFTGKSGAVQVSAAVTATATPIASGLGARLGKPNCPPVEKPKVGLTLQCLVGFDKNLVGWLVTLTAAGGLEARPTFPIASKRRLELLAGSGAVCEMPAFVGLPVGATVTCTAGKTTIDFAMTATGTVQRR